MFAAVRLSVDCVKASTKLRSESFPNRYSVRFVREEGWTTFQSEMSSRFCAEKINYVVGICMFETIFEYTLSTLLVSTAVVA